MYINAYCFIYEPEVDSLLEAQQFKKTKFPEFPAHINKRQLRRASTSSKMAMLAANSIWSLEKPEKPFSIHIGSGLAMIEDTTKFLNALVEYEEEAVSPTQFIQSTHNTISGQIAIMYQCHNHNFTFSQGGQSYEDAYLDAVLLSHDFPNEEVLVAGIDEINDLGLKILEDQGFLNQDPHWASEGAAFFRMSKEKKENSQLQIVHHLRGEKTTILEEVKSYVDTLDLKDFLLLGEELLSINSAITLDHFDKEIGIFHTKSAVEKAMACELLLSHSKRSLLILSCFANDWSFWHISKCV